MGFRCGIIGLPNVGKSTLFNALTAAGAAVANYPFCTLDPNVGVVAVPDERLEAIAKILSPPKVTHTTMEFFDIAGLVRGASRGEGLGNQFLGHIREVDAVVHVVRCFDNPHVVHVDGSVDPVRDMEVVNTELILADLETVERRIAKTEKIAKAGDRASRKDLETYTLLREHLGRGFPARAVAAPEVQEAIHRDLPLLTAKPVLYVANVSETDLERETEPARKMRAAAEREQAPVVAICGDLEAAIADVSLEERRAFLEDLGIAETGLVRLIREGYRLLGLLTFYTVVGTELRAWTVPRGTKAPGAAGRIHSDMERGFIRAEVLPYEEFVRLGGLAPARDKGLLRSEGKDYAISDGDIVTFRFHV